MSKRSSDHPSKKIESGLKIEAADADRILTKKSATLAFGWSVITTTIVKLVFPLASIFISRKLGPVQLGTFFIISTIVQFSEILRDAGLAQTYMSERDISIKKEGSYHFIAISTGVVLFLILVLLTPWLSDLFKLPELRWAIPLVSVASITNGFSAIPRAKMQRNGQIIFVSTLDLVAGAIGLMTAFTLVVFLNFDFVALVIQMLVTSIVVTFVFALKCKIREIHVSLDAFRQVGKKALAVFASSGINNVFLFSDQAVIGNVVGPTGSGYFGLAANLAYKPADFLVFPLTRTINVAFAQSSVDFARLSRIYSRAITVIIIAVVPIYVFLGIFGESVITILVGDQFAGSYLPLVAMCIYLTFRSFGNVSGSALIPAGKHSQTLYPWFGCIAITCIGLWYAVPQKQLMPIVWSFVAGATFVYGTLTALAMKHLKPDPDQLRRMVRALFAALFFAGVALTIFLLPIDAKSRLLLAILLGPVAHIMGIGTIFAGKAFEYLSVSGVKRLYHEF